MRRPARSLVLLTLASLAPLLRPAAPLQAQQISGTLKRTIDSLPVMGALVVLSDSAGHDVAHAISTDRGRFALDAPAGGTFRLRVLRIGLRPYGPHTVVVPATGRVAIDIYVRDVPIELPAMTVAAERRHCGSPPDTTVLGLLLVEARKAIDLTEATLGERRFMFVVETWRRRQTPDFRTIDSIPAFSMDRAWPIRSAAPESLRVWGFVRDEPDTAGHEATTYYGPDARVLFTDWFLDSHCLRLGRPRAPGLLALEFRPERPTRKVDISGRFVFDSASLALRELSWRWEGLPPWVPEEGQGGFVRFQEMPSGGWLPVAWSLRAPMEAVGRRSGPALGAYAEFGGRVAARSDHADSAVALAAAPHPATATIAGTVTDTVGRPIADVRVSARPSGASMVTDSAGRFRLDGLRPGITILHAQTVGFAPADFPVRVGADSILRVAIQLTPHVFVLDTVSVSTSPEGVMGLQSNGFYDRLRDRLRGADSATFIGPEDIERRHPQHTSDLLMGPPGVNLRYDHGKVIPYGRGQCQMNIWIDGHFMNQILYGNTIGAAGKFGPIVYRPPTTDLDDFVGSNEVAAVEIYASPSEVPRQFYNMNNTCGSIIIWTESRR